MENISKNDKIKVFDILKNIEITNKTWKIRKKNSKH